MQRPGHYLLACSVFALASNADAGETVSYSYDSLGRLVRVEHSGTVNSGVDAQYSYDAADNRTNVTVNVPPPPPPPPPPHRRLHRRRRPLLRLSRSAAARRTKAAASSSLSRDRIRRQGPSASAMRPRTAAPSSIATITRKAARSPLRPGPRRR